MVAPLFEHGLAYAILLPVTGVFLLSAFFMRQIPSILGVCLIVMALGIFWHEYSKDSLPEPIEEPQDVFFSGVVTDDPRASRTGKALHVKVRSDELDGKVLLFAFPFSDIMYGDRVSVSGRLEPAPTFEDFDYASFLARDGIYAVIQRPYIEVTEREGSGWKYALFSARQSMRSEIDKRFDPPGSILLSSIVLGDKHRIGEDLGDRLNIAGVRHITSISGMHVVIASALLVALFSGMNMNPRRSFYVVVAFLFLYILLTGFQTSAVRAGIMGGMFLLSRHVGRQNVSVRSLVIAATLMLLVSPLLLWNDVGFQLSFLAVLGIVLLLPWFKERLEPYVTDSFSMREVLGMSLAAQIFTMPVLLWHFGFVSGLSILANMLIVPILPFLLALGFFFVFTSFVWSWLGLLVAFPVYVMLRYILLVVDVFSEFPVITIPFL